MKICPSPHLVYAYLFSKYSLLDILTNMVFTARIKISSSRDICPGKKSVPVFNKKQRYSMIQDKQVR